MGGNKALKTLLTLSLSLLIFMVNTAAIANVTTNATEEKLQLKEPSLKSNFYEKKSLLQLPKEKTAAASKKFGLVDEPTELPKIKSKSFLESATTYPSSYDLRTLGKITPVKNQSTSGSCWAFATYGSLESKLLPGENRDFSENNLKNNSGFDIGPNAGGNISMSTAYLARGSGPINESDDPFNPSSTSSPTNKTIQKHVQNIDWLPGRINYVDNNFIKYALMKSGAIYTSIFYEDSSFNDTYDTYYDSFEWWKTYGNNHAVTIVGWDDNFDKTKFVDSYNGAVPQGNGAFIVKNSWGTSWGNKGYFYVSYYDKNFAMDSNAIYNGIEATTNYKSTYQYDPLGLVGNIGYNIDTAWMSNVFTASASENLSAVSFYTVVPDSKYEIYICSNYTGVNDLASSRILKASGTINGAGYHTVKLNSAVPLTSGKKFAVIIKMTTSGYGYQIPIESALTGYSSHATASSGQSYVSSSGSNWSDLTSVWNTTANICIKAFTTVATNQPPKVISTSPTNGATNVAVGNNLTVKFSEAILAGTNYGKITIKNSSGTIVTTKQTISGDTLTINPDSILKNSTKYTVTIPAGAVKDSAGALLASQSTFTFTSAATNQPPKVISTSPTNGATNVAVGNNLTVKFSETILAGTNFGKITIKNSSGTIVTTKQTISGNTLTINPDSNLKYNTKYTVTIPAGAVKDSVGAPLASQYIFTFTAVANTAPTVISTTPINLATNVVSYNNIYIKFTEPIFSGASYNNITVKNTLGTTIAITKSISGNTLLIHPNNFLLDNTKYTVTIPSGSIKDNANLGLIGQKTFSFTTAVNTAPIAVNVLLPNISLDYGNNIIVKFSEAIFSGTNYGNITVKNASGSVISTTKLIIGNTLIIDPRGNLAGNQKYTVTIPKAAVKDSKGMPLSSQYTATFTITT